MREVYLLDERARRWRIAALYVVTAGAAVAAFAWLVIKAVERGVIYGG